MSLGGGKAVSSSPLENIRPFGGKFVDSLEFPHDLLKDPKINNNFDHPFMEEGTTASCWRATDQDVLSLSKLYGHPPLSVVAKEAALNGGHYENGLFQSSLSDVFNKKLRLSSNDVFVDQSVNTTQFNTAKDEAFESPEGTEAQTIRDLLPDDDELLSGALHDLGYVAHSSRVDDEDDLFCSVGGMELESDDNFICEKSSEHDIGGAFNGYGRGLDNLPASELLQVEQSTRTLCVENISSDIENTELRVLFEQFGDIQTFFTSCRHRGYIGVSYYDIRAAYNAKRVLQFMAIRGQKLDIRFCILKDNPSEGEINDGVLLVTNLDSSISNVDLIHLFGVYGEIKEICSIPREHHHTCIEFYDVRAAEAALSAISKCDVSGGRIKVEPWDPREASLSSSSRQQLSLDLEEEESNRYMVESYSKKSPCFVPSGLIKHGANTSRDLHNEATKGMHTTFKMQNGPCMESKFSGISSSIPHNLSSPGLVAMVGNHYNQSNNYENSHSIGRMNFGFENMPTFPEFHGGVISGIPFNSPSTMSRMAMNASSTLANGTDNRNIRMVGSGSHCSHFKHNESVFNVSGNGSFPLHGHEFIWNSSNAYDYCHPGSLMWQNFTPLVNSIPAQSPHRGPSHMLNPVFPPHLHVGSAPVVDPLLWDKRHATFTGDATSFDPSSLGSMRYSSCSQLQSLEHNIFPQAGGTCIDPSIATARAGLPSPQQRGHMFRGSNNVAMPNSHDAPSDRIRSQRSDPNSNHADNRKQYELDIDRIIKGEDLRTTLMIKNIPNKYTSKMLLVTIDEQHKGTYDFIYLPIDFKNKCNVGYAFINLTDPQLIISFYRAFNGKKWEKFNSEKVACLAYARIQGKSALIAHFQNSSLMNEDKRCRPILFHSEGPNAGDQETFPVGVNIRSRRSKTPTENHQRSPSGSSSEDESSNSTDSAKGS